MNIPPFLAHLDRDARGRPAPWLNLRGAEAPERTRIAYDPVVGARAAFTDDEPGADVNFRQMSMGRQRRAMVEGLCSVCGKFVPWSRRNLVLSSVSVQVIDYGGLRVPAVTEPWLDDRCAEFAVRVCPALVRRGREDDLRVVPVRSRRQVVQFVSTGAVDGFPETWERGGQVAMWVKLALLPPHR